MGQSSWRWQSSGALKAGSHPADHGDVTRRKLLWGMLEAQEEMLITHRLSVHSLTRNATMEYIFTEVLVVALPEF